MIIKIILTFCLPFVLLWDIVFRVWYEIENIPRFIWTDICQEWSDYMRAMRE